MHERLRPARRAPCLAAALLLSLVPLVSLLAPSRADACSLSSDFLPPSNYEIVRQAPHVVLARVTSTTSRGGVFYGVAFSILETLRGSLLRPGEVITLGGSLGQYMGASAVGDFSHARPGAAAGACVAYDYHLGGQFLLLLRQSPSGWATLGTPFARVNEEVTIPDDPWLATVRHYVRIAALADPVKERAALEALRAAAEKSPSPSRPRELAIDIQRHARTPSAHKTFAELKAMYDAPRPEHPRPRALLAISMRGDPAAGAFMAKILRLALADPKRSGPLLDPLAHHFEKVPDSKSIQALAELYVKAGTGTRGDRWSVMWTLLRRAGSEHQATMQKALEGADDEEAGRLAGWFARHPSSEARAHLIQRVHGDYENKRDIAFALSAMGEKAPLDWALATLTTPSPPQRPFNNGGFRLGDKLDMRWVATYVVARSPLPEADRAAAAIIHARRDDFITLLQGYEEASHPNAARRLAQIAALPGLNMVERGWLDRATRGRVTPP